jgi:hypothetical protein
LHRSIALFGNEMKRMMVIETHDDHDKKRPQEISILVGMFYCLLFTSVKNGNIQPSTFIFNCCTAGQTVRNCLSVIPCNTIGRLREIYIEGISNEIKNT